MAADKEKSAARAARDSRDGETDPRAERKKALETALSNIEKQFGKGSIMKLGENSHLNVSAVSTGSLTLDMALGIGGLPRGRIVEIFGPESSGKTTLALHAVAEVQKAGGEAAFIDAEHALDPVYAKALGVNIDNLLVSQPDFGEQALEIADALISSGAVDIIVVDSVAALVPKEELDGEMGDKNMALQARLMSQALRKLSGTIARTNCILIFINQLRDSLKVSYGNPEVTTGGKALKFYASVRIDIRRTESLKTGTDVYGNHVKCKVVKNKVAPPFKIAEFDIIFGEGISREGEMIDLGVALDLVQKSGSWFAYGGTRIGQGKDNARKFLKENKAVADEIVGKIKAGSERLNLDMKEERDEDDDDELPGMGDNTRVTPNLDIMADDF